MLRQNVGGGDRDEVLIENFFGMQPGIIARAEPDRRMKVGAREVDHFRRCVNVEVDVRMPLVQIAQPRRQPLL